MNKVAIGMGGPINVGVVGMGKMEILQAFCGYIHSDILGDLIYFNSSMCLSTVFKGKRIVA